MAIKLETDMKIENAIKEIKSKLDNEIITIKAWVADQFSEKIGSQGNLNERLHNKANAGDVVRLRRDISEISQTLQKGFDSIILSAKNEVRAAIFNSATQDDFNYLKELKADKDEIQELRMKIQEMENKVSEFKDNNEMSISEEENDSDEHLDDVMSIDKQDDLLQEDHEINCKYNKLYTLLLNC